MIIKGSQVDSVAVMTDLKDDDGRYIFAFVALDQVGATERVNSVVSMYGRNNLSEYLSRCIEKGMIIAINKEKTDDLRLSIGGHFSKATTFISFDDTIAYSFKSVKYNCFYGE